MISASASGFAGENVGEAALQPAHDLLQAAQRDALRALLQPVKSRGREAELSGKLGIGHLPAPGAQESSELGFQ